MSATRILIVGKNGQVGHELLAMAAGQGVDAVGLGSADLDIRDRAAVSAAMQYYTPGAVINAAAYTAVDKAEEEKELAFAVNCDGVENLALACKAQDIPLIHISTDYVFDGDKEQPYLESDLPNPTSVYGSSKLAGEKILQAVWSKHFIVRVSWVFGPHGANFVKTMLRLASQRDELAVVADQFGAPTAATDIARVLLNLAVRAESNYGLYHLESNPAVSWHGFAGHIFQQAQAQGLLASQPLVKPIASDQFPTPVKRPANSKLAAENGLPAVYWPDSLAAMLACLPHDA